jgi:NADH:ubiquinone reductase (H+-translocating)
MEDSPSARHPPPHVVIIGGGFGGLSAARRLARQPLRVTLVDRRNHHLFQPLLYQVATAALAAPQIAAPLRSVLRAARNVSVLLAEVREVHLAARRVQLDRGHLDYDGLILATGATHSYFANEEWESLAPGLKTLEDAFEIRRRVLLAYEMAEWTADEAERRALLTFVVIGGGPTGVELAGALAEIARYTLASDFRAIDPPQSRIVLLEADDRLLQTFPRALSHRAEEALRRLGVEVHTGARVTHISTDGVWVGTEPIQARTVLWAAGVSASGLARSLGVELDRAGRVPVAPDLSVPGHPDVFVIGDLCALKDQHGRALPGLAPVAMQQGRTAADNVKQRLLGGETRPFRYRDHGMMATIGRGKAVATVGGLSMSGSAAWLAWLLVHIVYLIGFKNRVIVLIEWAWAYISFKRGARVVVGVWGPSARDGRVPKPASVSTQETVRANPPDGGSRPGPTRLT